MALTYHSEYKAITCVCGELITGKHMCGVKVSKIEVVVCEYSCRFWKKTEKRCEICIVQEQEKRYEDHWETDESGYCVCTECGDKTEGCLPKICACKTYVDNDGSSKCKGCKGIWEESYLESEECKNCGYDGD